MQRVPLFILSNMEGAILFANWTRDHLEEIQSCVCKVSSHATLVSLEPNLIGNMVNLVFVFETGVGLHFLAYFSLRAHSAGSVLLFHLVVFCCSFLN